MKHYEFDDFLTACRVGRRVFIWDSALDGAYKDFGILGREDLLDFISHEGFEDYRFQDSKPWQNNPDPHDPMYIDAYRFRS